MHTRSVVVARSGHPGWSAVQSALGSMPDVRIIGTPKRLAEAEWLAIQHQPSLLISPDEAGGERAIPILNRLRKQTPATRFLVIGDDYRADELLLMSGVGISCYLYWDDLLADLTENLRIAIAGTAVLLSDSIAAARLAIERYRRHDDEPLIDTTNREILALRGLVEGMSHREIAHHAGVGVRTVERTIERLQEKLKVSNSYALIMKAVQQGLLS